MAIIKARVPSFTGYRANVLFVNGVAETNNPTQIEWFKSRGYEVENTEPVQAKPVEPIKDVEELEEMSVDDLKSYAKAVGKGKGVGVLKRKEQIIEHLTKE